MFETRQLLILGNGFDLHCGLASSYEEFFKSKILDGYSEICKNPRMQDDCSGFWEGLLFQYYLKYDKTDYRWCDIETIIRNTLWHICFNNEANNINQTLWATAFLKSQNKGNVLNEFTIKDNIDEYLLKICIEFFKNISTKINTEYKIANLPLLLNEILIQLNNFEARFCKYIKNLLINPNNEKEKNFQYIADVMNLIAKIVGINNIVFDKSYFASIKIYDEYIEKYLNNLKNIHILSFNYTNVFDIIQLKNSCKYINVHGKLCSKQCSKECNNSNIIFGIDDTAIQSQNTIPELRLFSKTYRKMKKLTSSMSILPSNSNINPLEIKFYGHSFSSADYSYFQSLFDYYNIYDNTMVSLIFYYSKGYEQYDAIYDLINIYGNTLANKDQGKNLMHKLLLENRLKIVEID